MGVTRERVRQLQVAALRRLRPRAFECELDSFLERLHAACLGQTALLAESW